MLQYSAPFLLAFGLTTNRTRVLVWLGLILTVVGNFGVVLLPISSIQLEPIEIPGQTLYAPRFEVDYAAGAYPFLLGTGYLGGILYMAAYAVLALHTWRRVPTGEDTQDSDRCHWANEAGMPPSGPPHPTGASPPGISAAAAHAGGPGRPPGCVALKKL